MNVIPMQANIIALCQVFHRTVKDGKIFLHSNYKLFRQLRTAASRLFLGAARASICTKTAPD